MIEERWSVRGPYQEWGGGENPKSSQLGEYGEHKGACMNPLGSSVQEGR
jgi:hypothetical protein